MNDSKRLITWLFGAICAAALIAVFWLSPHKTKTVANDSHEISLPSIPDIPGDSQNVVATPTPQKRTITPEQAAKIKEILAPFAGSKIKLISKKTDPESNEFRDEIGKVVIEAGWRVAYLRADSLGRQPRLWLRISTADVPDGPYMGNAPVSRIRRNAAAVLRAMHEGLDVNGQLRVDPQLAAGEMELRVGSLE